ncbi:hypothetical protein QOT17_015409 [Balamuthia mandrillaris]
MASSTVTWRDVPNELWTEIFSCCPVGALLRCCLVSKEFCALASNDLLWQNIYFSTFGEAFDDEAARGEMEGLPWLERFKREVTSPKWDQARSEQPGIWVFSHNNKMITRNGSNGCYPKAIMTPNLFQLEQYSARLHFTLCISSELGLFTQPNLKDIFPKQCAFNYAYSGPSSSYISFHDNCMYHCENGQQKTSCTFSYGKSYQQDFTLTLRIRETGQSREAKRKVTFWVDEKKVGTLPLPKRPYELMFTSGNFSSSVRLERVEFIQ